MVASPHRFSPHQAMGKHDKVTITNIKEKWYTKPFTTEIGNVNEHNM